MNICIDGQPLVVPLTGIGRYTAKLIEHLPQHLNVTVGMNQIAKKREVYPISRDHFSMYNSRYPYKVIRRLMRPNMLYSFPYDFRSSSPFDIFHGINFTYMPIKHKRHVITIHDLAFMRYPETTSQKIYNHHMKWVPYCAEHADHILAVSEATKSDIVELLNIEPDRITVTPLAADDQFQPLENESIDKVIKKHGLPDRYILYVGTIEARKNLLTLAKAFHMIQQRYHTDYKLVIVGAKGWRTSPLYEYIEQHQLSDDIHFTGYIPDEDLPALYNKAALLAMPSWYEGFGLPLVEAMKCGTPVIGSNVSSIPEIIGAPDLLCSPHEPEQWADKIFEIIHNESLYQKRQQQALARACLYSWNHTAEITAAVYQQVMDSRK
ncbi:glycosyltransferase family 4 protein [Paenibacillus marinisediminis]